MKIYTRFGDQGKTKLVGGECVDKSNPRVECYGTVDELNSFLGLAATLLQEHSKNLSPGLKTLQSEILQIQHELFSLGSLIACEDRKTLAHLPAVGEPQILRLEEQIDRMSAQLPALKNFILPGGTLLASYLHVARTVCRRVERLAVELVKASSLQPAPLIYLNRLSDYLFVAARYANHLQKVKDQVWKKEEPK